MKPSQSNLSPIACDILAYLAEFPRAQDTVEGIMQWWVLRQEIKRMTTMVETGIAELVAQKMVLERRSKDGRVHYRINPRKAQAIRALLNRQEKCEPGSPDHSGFFG